MIKILERYIARTVFFSTAISALVISGVLLLMLLLGEIKSIGSGEYNFYRAMFYVLLRMPSELYHFSPMLILLGSIISLSILSTHKELAVMRVSGFAVTKIIISVMNAAFIIILMISLVGELIGPHLNHKAEIAKENAKNEGQAVVTSAGVWMHVQNNFIHIKQVIGRQLLEGVRRYEFDDHHRLQATYYAKKLAFQNNRWQMVDGAKTLFYPEHTISQTFKQEDWNLSFNPGLLSIGLEPSQMSLSKLSKFSRYLKKNGLQETEYRYEYWQRIFQPFASLLMIFLAIPFVLSTQGKSTLGWRIVAGISVGFSFYILNAFLGQLCIVFQLPPALAALLPLVLFTIFGFFFSNRLIKR